MEIKSLEIDSKFELVYNMLDGLLADSDLSISQALADTKMADGNRIGYLFNNISELAFILNKNGEILFFNNQVRLEYGDEGPRELYLSSIVGNSCYKEFEKMNSKKNLNVVEISGDLLLPNESVLPTDFFFGRLKSEVNRFLVLASNRIENDAIYRKVVDVQEEERSRLAIDMHDSIGQQLTAIKLYLNTAVANLEQDKMVPVSKAVSAMDATIQDMRNICFNLLPRTLENNGLFDSLRTYFKRARSGYQLDFEWDFDQMIPRLDKDFEVAVFRMFQEFMSNSVRHGKATLLTCKINQRENHLIIEFKDNGVGFDVDLQNDFGMGIKNIITRTRLFNGNVKISSSPDNGTAFLFAFNLDSVID